MKEFLMLCEKLGLSLCAAVAAEYQSPLGGFAGVVSTTENLIAATAAEAEAKDAHEAAWADFREGSRPYDDRHDNCGTPLPMTPTEAALWAAVEETEQALNRIQSIRKSRSRDLTAEF